jgi:hypothetical protein
LRAYGCQGIHVRGAAPYTIECQPAAAVSQPARIDVSSASLIDEYGFPNTLDLDSKFIKMDA